MSLSPFEGFVSLLPPSQLWNQFLLVAGRKELEANPIKAFTPYQAL